MYPLPALLPMLSRLIAVRSLLSRFFSRRSRNRNKQKTPNKDARSVPNTETTTAMAIWGAVNGEAFPCACRSF